jgi:outer membrane protein assembly factor BamA
LAAAADGLLAQGDDRENPEIKRLNLRGVSAVAKEELLLSIKTEASRCRSILVKPFCLFSNSRFFVEKHYLDRPELRRDMLRIRVFYWKRGYRQARVDTVIARKGDEAVVDFRITEGPPTLVTSITVTRAQAVLSDKTIARNMRLKAGKPLNLLALDSSAVLLRDVLGDAGYGDAVVKIDTIILADSARTAAVRMSVDPKWKTVIGEITIRGLEKISERTIRNSLTLKVGKLYKRNDLITSQRNLYESNLFRRAVIIIPPLGDSIKT